MNKELEEAAEKYAHNYFEMHDTNHYKALKQGFEAGAKYMQKRMYSEEEMREAIIFGLDGMYGYQWGKEGETNNQINKYLEELKKK
jgi:hypothetical protein